MAETKLMGGEKSDFQRTIEKLLESREWLNQNIDQLASKYGGNNWVAILGEEVIASGSNPGEVLTAIGEKRKEALIICVPDGEIQQPIIEIWIAWDSNKLWEPEPNHLKH